MIIIFEKFVELLIEVEYKEFFIFGYCILFARDDTSITLLKGSDDGV
jgi:hypothetical protein